MYATSRVPKHRSIQDNLRIDMFARKHGLTVEQVEIALKLEGKRRKTYLKQLTQK